MDLLLKTRSKARQEQNQNLTPTDNLPQISDNHHLSRPIDPDVGSQHFVPRVQLHVVVVGISVQRVYSRHRAVSLG